MMGPGINNRMGKSPQSTKQNSRVENKTCIFFSCVNNNKVAIQLYRI